MTLNVVLSLIGIGIAVAGVIGAVAVKAYYCGWDKGFAEGCEIWRTYGNDVGKVWEQQYRELAERRGVVLHGPWRVIN